MDLTKKDIIKLTVISGNKHCGEGERMEFISEAHEFAVTEYQNALICNNLEAIAIAVKVAESMGLTQKYTSNPFDARSLTVLHDAFEHGVAARLSPREDMYFETKRLTHGG